MDRATVVLLALVLAPWALVALALLARGYDVHLTLRRRRHRRDD